MRETRNFPHCGRQNMKWAKWLKITKTGAKMAKSGPNQPKMTKDDKKCLQWPKMSIMATKWPNVPIVTKKNVQYTVWKFQ